MTSRLTAPDLRGGFPPRWKRVSAEVYTVPPTGRRPTARWPGRRPPWSSSGHAAAVPPGSATRTRPARASRSSRRAGGRRRRRRHPRRRPPGRGHGQRHGPQPRPARPRVARDLRGRRRAVGPRGALLDVPLSGCSAGSATTSRSTAAAASPPTTRARGAAAGPVGDLRPSPASRSRSASRGAPARPATWPRLRPLGGRRGVELYVDANGGYTAGRRSGWRPGLPRPG